MNQLLLTTAVLGMAAALLAYSGRTGGGLASPVVIGVIISVILAASVVMGVLIRKFI